MKKRTISIKKVTAVNGKVDKNTNEQFIQQMQREKTPKRRIQNSCMFSFTLSFFARELMVGNKNDCIRRIT